MIDLYNGDCLEVMKQIPDKSVDLILCDLPYGTTASSWDQCIPADKMWEQYLRIISDVGSILLFSSGVFTMKLMCSMPGIYKYKWVWVKRNSTNFVHAKNRPMSKHEDILVFSKAPMGHKSLLGGKRMTYNPQGVVAIEKSIKEGRNAFGTIAGVRPSHVDEYVRKATGYPVDVLLDYPELSQTKKVHTNQKPTDLLEFLIKSYTDPGMTVLDNCMGSGSTGVAAVQTGRDFIGIELDPKYFEIAQSRINAAAVPAEIENAEISLF